jgi:predicted transcriptional regulator
MAVSFTDRELDVMAVLWQLGSATVADVRERLDDELAYTTVLTVLRTLEEKGHVGHRGAGKAHEYYPMVARQAAGRSALARLVDKVFGGSAELLLTQLVSDRGLSRDELERLRAVMDEQLSEDTPARDPAAARSAARPPRKEDR